VAEPARLLHQYLTDPAVYRRGQAVEWVDVGGEGDVLAELQAALRREVGRRGITVEVNPSSNLLVGDLADLTRHPLWRLAPPRPVPEAPPVAVCFGSDDPITFATAIREEYQLVSDALMAAGLSEQEARHWLDQARRNGLEARFTVWRP
jgi:adenosine deaminase